MRKEIIGDCTLYLGDCLEIIPKLGRVDAVVTDPPYGIGVDVSMAEKSGQQYGKAAAKKGNYIASGWDDVPMDIGLASDLIAMSDYQIFWGGNYYGLPASRCWLVWDKVNGTNQFADCELAWTNLDKPVRKFEWMWNGMLRKGGEERNGHPTQKPLKLMEWCINHLPDSCQTILDPFMGSGTTGVDCVKLGRKFIGIEKEPHYFDIACRRIEEAYKQPDMLVQKMPEPVQEAFV